MKKWFLIPAVIIVAALVIPFATAKGKKADKAEKAEKAKPADKKITELKTKMDKVSYAIGISVGFNFIQNKIDADVSLVVRGVSEILSGKTPEFKEEEMKKVFEEYRAKRMKESAPGNAKKDEPEKEEKGPFKTLMEKVSYCIGLDIGMNFKKRGANINPEVFGQGVTDTLAQGEKLLTDKEAQEVLMAYEKDLNEQQAEKNKKEGEKFLADNKKKKGIVTTDSGLQYEVIKEGKGKKPVLGNSITVHYRGTTIDGMEFDSSYKRNKPITFKLVEGGLIKGWTEALPLMETGAKWRLFIPSDLAYGLNGAPRAQIGPNSMLIFEVELIEVTD